MSNFLAKRAIRQQLIQIRQEFIQNHTSDYQIQAEHILKKLVDRLKSNNSQKIAIYYPLEFELSILNIIDSRDLPPETEFYLPRISKYKQFKLLDFLLYSKNYTVQGELKPNRFGILEPVETAQSPKINLLSLDAIVVPMVAFTPQKVRIGYGGGYYDATIGKILEQSRKVSKPVKKSEFIGVALDCQSTEILPQDPWDIDLDCIITGSLIIE